MADALRVLHVITGLGSGGAEGQLSALLIQAPRADMVPRVIGLLPGGEHAARLSAAGIAVGSLGMRRGVPDPFAVPRLAHAIRDYQPDVVQSWMYHADLLSLAALALIARRDRPRLVWGVRCSDMDVSRYGRALRWTIALSARFSARPDAVVVNSRAGQRAHEDLGYRPRRFAFIPNGIDTARFQPDEGARVEMRRMLGFGEDDILVMHVARRDPMKDHENFLASLDAVPGVTGIAIGLGTEALPDKPNLRRLGARHDVARLLAAGDLFVSSSAFGEGFSNAVAEAMATGLPAIATDVGDARAILGDTGIVVPARDRAALAHAIGRITTLPRAERQALGRAARRRIADEFPLARAAERFAVLYREIV
ncbi:MAG: glycosyltransferase [Alphaproteobacteria bacterium]